MLRSGSPIVVLVLGLFACGTILVVIRPQFCHLEN